MRRRKRMLEELDQDIREHLERETQDNIERGMSPAEARTAARRKFGNVTRVKEKTREVWSIIWLEQLVQDVGLGLRMIRKAPGFSIAAILTLALGIGPNTAIFTVIDAVLLRPLPYANPQELVTWPRTESQLDIDDIRSQSTFFSAGGGVNPEVLTYTGGAEPVGVNAGYVDAGLFETFGVAPMLGRVLSREEDRFGGPRVVRVFDAFTRMFVARYFSTGRGAKPKGSSFLRGSVLDYCSCRAGLI